MVVQTLEGATMPVSVWTSTLRRTIQTAELLPFPKLRWKVSSSPASTCSRKGQKVSFSCTRLRTTELGRADAMCHFGRRWMRYRRASLMAGHMRRLPRSSQRSMQHASATSSDTGTSNPLELEPLTIPDLRTIAPPSVICTG